MKNKKHKGNSRGLNLIFVRAAMRRIKDYLKRAGRNLDGMKQDHIIQMYCTITETEVSGVSLRDWAVLAYQTGLLPEVQKSKIAKPLDREVSFTAKKYKKKLGANKTEGENIFAAKLTALGVHYEQNKIFNHEFGVYMPDFYVPSKNIIIEIDGGHHRKSPYALKDVQRDTWFMLQHKIKTYRFSNEHVKNQSLEYVKLFFDF